MQERSDIECTFLERTRGKQSRSDQGRKRCDSKNHLQGSDHADTGRSAKAKHGPI